MSRNTKITYFNKRICPVRVARDPIWRSSTANILAQLQCDFSLSPAYPQDAFGEKAKWIDVAIEGSSKPVVKP